MNGLSSLDLALIFIYFAILLVIGYFSSRKQNDEDFLIADRKLGPLSSMATINASKTGSVVMLLVAFVYLWGIGAVWYVVGQVVGLLLFLPFAMKLRKKSHKYYTLAHYFKDNYGKKSAMFASLITIFLMIGFLIINVIAGTKIFVYFSGWPFWLCALIVVIIVLAYLLMAGFKAVAKTDIVQYVAMVFILCMLIIIYFNGSSVPASEWNLFTVDIGTLIGFFLVGILFPFSMPDMWQRVYSARDNKSLKHGIILSSAIYGFFGFMLALIALTVKMRFAAADPDVALLLGFQSFLPSGILGLAIVLLFAAIMSTIDTGIFTAASSIIHDFTEWDKKKTVKYIRWVMVVLTVFGLFVAILLQNMIISSYILAAFIIVLAIVVIATWIKNNISETTVMTGLIIGLIGVIGILIYCYAVYGDIKPMLVVASICLTTVGLILGSIISRSISKN